MCLRRTSLSRVRGWHWRVMHRDCLQRELVWRKPRLGRQVKRVSPTSRVAARLIGNGIYPPVVEREGRQMRLRDVQISPAISKACCRYPMGGRQVEARPAALGHLLVGPRGSRSRLQLARYFISGVSVSKSMMDGADRDASSVTLQEFIPECERVVTTTSLEEPPAIPAEMRSAGSNLSLATMDFGDIVSQSATPPQVEVRALEVSVVVESGHLSGGDEGAAEVDFGGSSSGSNPEVVESPKVLSGPPFALAEWRCERKDTCYCESSTDDGVVCHACDDQEEEPLTTVSWSKNRRRKVGHLDAHVRFLQHLFRGYQRIRPGAWGKALKGAPMPYRPVTHFRCRGGMNLASEEEYAFMERRGLEVCDWQDVYVAIYTRLAKAAPRTYHPFSAAGADPDASHR